MHTQSLLQLKVEEIQSLVMNDVQYILEHIDTIKKCDIEKRLGGLYEILRVYK
jgi:hypothetical protein